jgi:archaemetzincin
MRRFTRNPRSAVQLPPRTLAVIPIHPMHARELDQISTQLRARDVTVRIKPSTSVPRECFDASRGQLKADMLLRRVALAKERPVLGITDADCYADQLNFVFGIADLGAGSAIVSLARLRAGASRSTFIARAIKEIFHELGHAVGLEHCDNRCCVMSFSNSLAEADAKGEGLCAACRRRLRARGSAAADRVAD